MFFLPLRCQSSAGTHCVIVILLLSSVSFACLLQRMQGNFLAWYLVITCTGYVAEKIFSSTCSKSVGCVSEGSHISTGGLDQLLG